MAKRSASEAAEQVEKHFKVEESDATASPTPVPQPPDAGDDIRPSEHDLEASSGNNIELSEQELQAMYRDLDRNIGQDRVEATRNGDIQIALKRLEAADELFEKVKASNSHKNSLFEQDSRTVLGVSELAELSVRNMKLENSQLAVNRGDIVGYAKQYMLHEYFERNNIQEGRRATGVAVGSEESEVSGLRQHGREQENFQRFEQYDSFAQFNWFKLGMLYQTTSRAPAVLDHLLGPFGAEKKTRTFTQGTRAAADPVGVSVTAQRVGKDGLGATQEKTTPGQVKRCFKTLINKRGYKQIGLYQFAIDSRSFARSVENLFYTSFLIKEGKVVLEEDENGFPAIRAANTKSGDANDSSHANIDARQNHLIFQMDMATWRKLIRHFDIQGSFIP
ncbi:LAFA_0G09208g1_1 [Lachancea sp. 'fantastica']|nr:LAFA_0G09208g1_1 [Lachancea sp. 'fantastica']